jgi:hypothetical protein
MLGACVLISPLNADAQCLTGLQPESRTVSGRVTNDAGDPILEVVIQVVGTECAALTDSAGVYSVSAPISPVEVRATMIGHTQAVDSVLSSGDTTLDFVLQRAALGVVDNRRIDDWSQFQERPAALSDPEGVVGCYWAGHLFTGIPNRTFRLFPDGQAQWSGKAYWNWTLDELGKTLTVQISGVDAGASVVIDLSADPMDWSAIPAEFFSWAMFDRGPTYESFVVRVECPAPALPN